MARRSNPKPRILQPMPKLSILRWEPDFKHLREVLLGEVSPRAGDQVVRHGAEE
jgi:hypothetical protein